MSTTRVAKKPTTRKPSLRDAHNHCEARNDTHVDYCREPARHIYRHPRGLMGVLFVCQEHAHDAVGEGKRLVVAPTGILPAFVWSGIGEGSRLAPEPPRWPATELDAEPCESRSDFAVDDDDPDESPERVDDEAAA